MKVNQGNENPLTPVSFEKFHTVEVDLEDTIQ